MPSNTARGFPYPLPAEPVAAGADNIKALAQAIDTKRHVQQGTVTITMPNAATGNIAVTFPQAFTRAPRVMATIYGQSACIVYLSNTPTLTGAVIGVRHYRDTVTSIVVPVGWIATDAA